ncbi:YbgA family protein [Anaerococcus cruorum]|uniref:YbgA family protein n=1 Tax=Anaerococcus sp. WGS1529 TaxID=3366812 RepID=UPI00372D6BB4
MSKEERKKAENLWAQNKYLVLSKSHKYYLSIRDYLKGEDLEVASVKKLIDKALDLPENKKDVVNAYQHIWSYFKEDASPAEKEKFLSLIDFYQKDIIAKEEVLDYLKILLEKYPYDYLQKSTIFKEKP